jgi:hypothetical protein
MQLFKSWKSSQSFRQKVVIFFFVAILVFFFMPEKKEANLQLCESYNTDVEIGGTNTRMSDINEYEACISKGCVIQYEDNPKSYIVRSLLTAEKFMLNLVFGGEIDALPVKCVLKAEVGKWVSANSQSDAQAQCSSSAAVKSTDRVWNDKDLYTCTPAIEEGEQGYGSAFAANTICKSWQKPFAQIFRAAFKDGAGLDCSTQAYATIGIGAVAVLAVI